MEIKRILEAMNGEEKEGLICGTGEGTRAVRLIPSLKIEADGFGHCRSEFPTAAAVACSWDAALAYGVGRELGRSCCASGIHVTEKIPCISSELPLSGERYRYLSSSETLTTKLASAYIDGVQSTGVGALARVGNDKAELCRVLKECHPKALSLKREQFPLAAAVKADGYDGAAIARSGEADSRSDALRQGIDLTLGSAFDERECLKGALESGDVTAGVIDSGVERVLKLIDETYDDHEYDLDGEEQRLRCERYAADCIVMLANDGVLPLSGDGITVMGELAERIFTTGEEGGEQRSVSLLDALKTDRRVKFVTGYAEGEDLSEEALERSYPDESVVVVLGDYDPDCPNLERSLDIPEEQLVLCERLRDSGREVVAVLVGGGAKDVKRLKNMSALLFVPYLGGGAAKAIKSVICGELSPSGRLAEDFCSADEVIYPLGHGLTYSGFEYKEPRLAGDKVTLDIVNKGRYAAAETVQIYCGDSLVAFEKIRLRAGETRAVSLEIPEADGELKVGASRTDIRYTLAAPQAVTKKPTESEPQKTEETKARDGREIDLLSAPSDIEDTAGGKKLVKRLQKLALDAVGGDVRRAGRLLKAAENTPMYVLAALSDGAIDLKFLSGCIAAKESVVGALLKRVGIGVKKDG